GAPRERLAKEEDLPAVRRAHRGRGQRSRRLEPLRGAPRAARGGLRRGDLLAAGDRGGRGAPAARGGGVESATRSVRVGIIGKYVSLPDAYLSVVEALRHGGFHHGSHVEVDWIQAEEVEGLLAEGRLRDLDGIVIPGGFGERGV